MKKHLYILFFIVLSTGNAFGQNRISYSQYMHNNGVFNPAYFDPENRLTATAYYKNQWVGIDGAPVTKSLVAGYTINDKHNVNLNLHQDEITIFRDTKFGLGYTFKLKLTEESLLSFGIKADYGIFNSDYTSLNVQDIDDDVVLTNNFRRGYFNMGIGMYYQSDYFFGGLSAPYLFNNSLLDPQYGDEGLHVRFNHIYMTMGGKVELTDAYFFPTALIKVVSGSPVQLDVNANFLLRDRFWLSGGIRTDLTFILSTGVVLDNGLKFVYSYDMTALAPANASSGSHELSLGYGLSFYHNSGFTKRRYLRKGGLFKRRRRGG